MVTNGNEKTLKDLHLHNVIIKLRMLRRKLFLEKLPAREDGYDEETTVITIIAEVTTHSRASPVGQQFMASRNDNTKNSIQSIHKI